jgi:serine/threonine-protein phosphatase PGAM5
MARSLLYLVRHGQQDLSCDHANGGLSQLGREQAHQLGRRLGAIPFSAIHHSGLPRAVQTADVVAGYLPQVPRHACDFVADRTPVPSAGQRGRYPDRWLAWLDGVPDDERDEDAVALQSAVEHFGVTGHEDRHELLITHNFVIGWFVRETFGAPRWRWLGLNQANCGLTIIRVRSAKPPVLITHNDLGHLPPELRSGLPLDQPY